MIYMYYIMVYAGGQMKTYKPPANKKKFKHKGFLKNYFSGNLKPFLKNKLILYIYIYLYNYYMHTY